MASTTSSSTTVTRPPASSTSTGRHAMSNSSRPAPAAITASTRPVIRSSTDVEPSTTTHCSSVGFLLPCRHTRAPSTLSREDTRATSSFSPRKIRQPIPRPAAIVMPSDGIADTASAFSSARSTEYVGRPATKSAVPLIGSTSHRRPDVPTRSGRSSPATPSSGTASASNRRTRSSTSRSAGVTSLPSSLSRTPNSPARNARSATCAARPAIRNASRMSVHMTAKPARLCVGT
nr:hypothetical protein [Lentzea albidocapillata]